MKTLNRAFALVLPLVAAWATLSFADDAASKTNWLDTALPIIWGGVVMLVGWVCSQIGRLITQAIKNSKNTADDRLAAIAVAWIEDKMGAGKGEQKLRAAAERIVQLSKNKLTFVQAEELARAAYQSTYGELKNLKN